MADAEPLLVSEAGACATLTLNRPANGNSLSMGLVQALTGALAALAPREDIKVIVIRAAGSRIFSAGHDLNEFAGDPDPAFLAADFAGIAGLMQAIMAQPQIVVARVEGVATAAGLELVTACDLALAATTARFALPGVNIGFWCHTPQVAVSRTVGPKQAMELLVTGRLYPAEHALRIGLVNGLHPPDELDAALDALVATICAKASSVLRAGKASFRAQAALPVAAAYAEVQGRALANITHPDAREGVAAFLEKRDPNWLI
ncbi:enoyl-CoA hydratase-related protein [Sandarakinorhabdus rubra]|uniref:enoyl-CoA hydratase-related protein n=1 Tax=Sandarakinorhabdus rubra TaxID=2672568 RepID=UPI0013DC5733|nr:enoyl-CoA hydratase-related protein [Sandarakinorhabdus rubra]